MTDEDKEKKEKVSRHSMLSFKSLIKDKNKILSSMILSKPKSHSSIAFGKVTRSSVTLMKPSSHSNQGLGKSCSRMKMRKPSYGFGGVPGIKPLDRASQMVSDFKRPALTHLPTYQLEPYVKFHNENVMEVAETLLDAQFTGHKYDIMESPSLALRIAGDLMRLVKFMEFNRYRIITIVTIGQKKGQSYNNAVTFLWDHERDNYVDVHRENTSCFIQVTVFGIYFD